MRSAVLLHNPAAGRGAGRELVDSILDALRRSGFSAQARPTTAAGSATRQARDAADAGTEVVLAYGGDGTLRETAFGLLGTETALGFIPGGTVNVMALMFGLPRRPVAAAEALANSEVRDFDVGLCNGSPFLMQASAGIDAELIRRLDSRLKRWFARGAILPAALGALFSYSFPRIEVVADGRRYDATLAAVCNIPFYGGKWLLTPDARPDDRKLDLVLFHGRGRWATLGLARDLFFGRHLKRSDLEIRRVDEVELGGDSGFPVQVDGDALPGEAPFSVRLAGDRLKVLVARDG